MTGGADGPIRVAVVGCGAIGSLYAAHLARVPGVEVWAVDPWTSTWTRWRRRACGSPGSRTSWRRSTREPTAASCPSATSGSSPPRRRTRARRCRARGPPWPRRRRQRAERARKRRGHRRAGAARHPRQHHHGGRGRGARSRAVRRTGDSWFGPFEPRPALMSAVEQLARLLTEGGLRTHALKDARGPQWTKVIFNSATSPLSALTGLSVGRVCTDARLRQQVDRLVTEAMAVCERAGIVLTRSPLEAVDEAIAEASSTSRACCRTSSRAATPRSTSSTAASVPRGGGWEPPPRCMTPWWPWSRASNGPGRLSQDASAASRVSLIRDFQGMDNSVNTLLTYSK